MDAVTYPDDLVQQDLQAGFVGLKINIMDRHPDSKAACQGHRPMWAPTLVFSDADHRPLRRFVGWLPAESFRAELAFVRAYASFQRGKFDDCKQQLETLLDRFADTEVAAESRYTLGMAGFLAGGQDWDALKSAWKPLAADPKAGRFATHASVEEDAP